ncbi:MAG TPA: SBBP repeat-containing protein [Bryobacteraceae bacterium]|nr:SBBP repeat-containing protein [Bryobacteraceae bacterium]
MFAAPSEFTTWIAGGNQYKVARIAADAAGDTFIAGTRTFPTYATDIFIVKLDPAGNIVLFREVSGGDNDQAADMAVDSAGNIYVAGSTSSRYFPVVNALLSTPGPGFLFKMSADGSQFLWSTYYREAIAGLALDSSGNIYVTGTTNDAAYPVTPGLPAGPVTSGLAAVSGAFLTKISAAGDRIVYSAVISGSGHTCTGGSSCFLSPILTRGVAVAVDAAGDAFLAGNTNAATLPITPGAPITSGSGAFVASVKADGSALTYLTLVGPTYLTGPFPISANVATAIAADATGNAYLTGSTFDTKFPATEGGYQTTYGGPVPINTFNPPTDAFVLKLNPTGTAAVWASYLGGDGADSANSIALDSSGQAWIAGTTSSSGFPNAQGFIAGSDFVAGFSASGSQLVYSARFPNDGASRGVAADATGVLHVAGPTGTVSTLNATGALISRIFGIANAANGPLDAVIAHGEVISIYGPHIGPSTPAIATADASGNLPKTLAGYQVLMGGQPISLLYVSDSQINAIVDSLSIPSFSVSGPSGATPAFTAAQVNWHPQIFRNPDDSAIAVNQDGTLNSQTNPAHVGTYEAIWVSGAASSILNAGQIATSAYDYNCCFVSIGGTLEGAVYGGLAPGAASAVSQVNFLVNPRNLYSNGPVTQSLAVQTQDGTYSLPVDLWVTK